MIFRRTGIGLGSLTAVTAVTAVSIALLLEHEPALAQQKEVQIENSLGTPVSEQEIRSAFERNVADTESRLRTCAAAAIAFAEEGNTEMSVSFGQQATYYSQAMKNGMNVFNQATQIAQKEAYIEGWWGWSRAKTQARQDYRNFMGVYADFMKNGFTGDHTQVAIMRMFGDEDKRITGLMKTWDSSYTQAEKDQFAWNVACYVLIAVVALGIGVWVYAFRLRSHPMRPDP